MIYKSYLETPLGEMVAYASEEGVILFTNTSGKEQNHFIQKKLKSYNQEIVEKENSVIQLLKKEIEEYFQGTLKQFKTKTIPQGTDFQKKAWEALKTIPYGTTISYQQQAEMVSDKKAVRAIGGANSKNPIVIIIPCHRVIAKNGDLTGFAIGIEKKEWLLNHEKTNNQ